MARRRAQSEGGAPGEGLGSGGTRGGGVEMKNHTER